MKNETTQEAKTMKTYSFNYDGKPFTRNGAEGRYTWGMVLHLRRNTDSTVHYIPGFHKSYENARKDLVKTRNIYSKSAFTIIGAELIELN